MAHMWEWHGKTSDDMVLMWGLILESVKKTVSLYYHVPELKKFSVRRKHVPLLLLMFHSCQTTVEEGNKPYFVPNP